MSDKYFRMIIKIMGDDFKVASWQEFEELTRDIVDLYGFKTEFRKVFKNKKRKFEIDVVAEKENFCFAIDCKRYGHSRYRKSQLKSEALNHSTRCKEFEKLKGKRIIPLIASFLDDDLVVENGCIFVPIKKVKRFFDKPGVLLGYPTSWFLLLGPWTGF
ncbi:MAG: restriction endonuclease [Candidatus Hydrothermarchaeales archaeon]